MGSINPPRPDQRTLTAPRHGSDLSVGLALFQEGQCQGNLLRGEFLRPAFPIIGILLRHRFSCPGALDDLRPLEFGKGQHDRQDQVAGGGILNQPHIQDMHSDTPLKKLSDRGNPINCGACEAIQLGDNKCIPRLQLLKKGGKLVPGHGLSGKGFSDDFLTAIDPECLYLAFQTVAVPALSGGGYSCVAVNHGFFLRFYDPKFWNRF